MLSALDGRGVSYPTDVTAVEAKRILPKWVTDNVESELPHIVRENMHELIFTPPQYSDLQLIELVWGRVKSAVGRQYDCDSCLIDVKNRLHHEFAELETENGSEPINNIINHVYCVIQKSEIEIQLEGSTESQNPSSSSIRT